MMSKGFKRKRKVYDQWPYMPVFEAYLIYPSSTPSHGTHLVAVRGLIHQQVPNRVRQRGELD